MIEIPHQEGRLFQLEQCSVVLQPQEKFVYLLVSCHCHKVPTQHLANVVHHFDLKRSLLAAPYSREYLHLIEDNEEGEKFARALISTPS